MSLYWSELENDIDQKRKVKILYDGKEIPVERLNCLAFLLGFFFLQKTTFFQRDCHTKLSVIVGAHPCHLFWLSDAWAILYLVVAFLLLRLSNQQ